MNRIITCLVLVIFASSFSGIVYASVSNTIPMQGRLLGQGGNPLTGLQNMTFAIYESVSGGVALWSESGQVQTNNGLFSVVLGQTAPMNLAFDKDYYVEISVNYETLSPRQKLLAAPYSQSARNVYGDVVEIKGPVTVVDNDNTGYIRIGRDITNAIGATIRYIQNGDYLGLSASHEGQDALVIRSDGNVGIGTITPVKKLDIAGSLKADEICIGNDCKINWPVVSSDPQFNSLEVAGNITSSSMKANRLCIGNDCRTEWPVASSQLNIVALNTTGNITSAGSMKMAGNLLIGLQPPAIKSMTSASQTGGTLTNPTQYCYRVSAVNSAGETKASGSQCITTQAGHNTVTMQWDTVQFAASYNIYGRTAGVIGLLTSTANTQFTDNGIAIPGSAPLELSTSGRLDISGSVTVKGTLNIAKTIVPVPATGYGKLYVDNNGELNYMKEDGSAYSLNSISNPNQIIKNFIVESGEQINTGDIVSLANGKIIKGRGIKEYESDICAGCYDTVMEKLTNSSFLIIYRDSLNSYKGTALIATAGTNGFTISAPAVFSAGNIGYVKTVVLSSDKFVVVYYDETNQNSGTVIIGTVSGSTISFGAPVVFNIGYTTYMNIDKLASDKVVISYTDNGNSQYGTAVIGTISGTGISFGSEYIYNNKPTTGASLVVMSADKLIIGFNDRRGYEYIGSVVIASVSGTSLSFDAAKYDFTSDYVSLIDMKKLTSNKFLITYSSNSRSGYGNALVGRLSNTIEYGPNYTFVLDYPYNLAAETFPDDSFVIVFNHQYQGKYQVGLVSGIADNFSISLKPRYLLVPYSSSNINPVYAAGRLAISYKPDSNMIGKITMNNPNKIGYIIGIAKQSGIGGNSIPVVLGGISTEYNNLLPGTVYYTNDNGILTRAVNMNKIGMALSQNELLLDIAR